MSRSPASSTQIAIVRREARTLAAAIDLVIAALIGVCFAALSLVVMLIQVDPFERDPTAAQWVVGYAVFLLWMPAVGVYAGLGSRTVGARLLRLRVTPNSRTRAIVRGAMWWPSALLFGAGLWWAWIDPRGRSLTDVVSGAAMVETLDP